MPSVSVHIAVLTVGKDAAPAQAVFELATQAGHDVVARATVSDTLAAVKGQVQLWIDDPAIEAVIVCAGAVTAATVKSLERGATHIFTLPPVVDLARAGMRSDVLPQLQRMRAPASDAVPVAMAPEKTASGSGIHSKLPSMGTMGGARRSPTGANVVRKPDPASDSSFDPPTKPIDLDALEKQIALSTTSPHDQLTRQVDLSRLPKVPPGADPLPDETKPAPRGPRLESAPIEPPAPKLLPDPPAPRGPVPLPDSGHTPIAPLPAIAPVPATRTKPPTEQNPVVRTKQVTGPIGVPAVIPKTASGSHAVPRQKPPTRPVPVAPKPVEPPPREEPASEATTEISADEIREAVVETPRKKAPTQPPPPPRPRPPTGPVPVARAAMPPPRPPTGPVPVAKAKAEEPDIGALIAPPLRRSSEAIPASKRPAEPKGSNKLVFALGAIAALAIGFVLVVFVFPKSTDTPPPAPAPSPAPVVAAAPIDAAVDIADAPVAVATNTPADIEMDAMETSRGSATRPTGPRPTGTSTPGPVTRPEVGSAATPPPAVTPDAAVADDKVENAPNNPTGGDECDEVSCVLAKYDRPCCERYKPKQADIAPRTAGGVPEELDKSMVRAGVEKVKPRVVACGEKAGAKGTVKISVTVAPDGNVTAATVASSPDPTLGDCVAGAMKNATFGKSVNGGSFTYPFVF